MNWKALSLSPTIRIMWHRFGRALHFSGSRPSGGLTQADPSSGFDLGYGNLSRM